MEVYKYIEQDNGDIKLEKIIIDLSKYDIIEDDGNKILKKITYLNIENIKEFEFTKSTILQCFINNEKFDRLYYRSILDNIYNIIGDGTTIIKNSIMNIKTVKRTTEGFNYIETLGISVQGVDANKTITEIINQCCKNNIKLIMVIQLKDNNIVNVNM